MSNIFRDNFGNNIPGSDNPHKIEQFIQKFYCEVPFFVALLILKYFAKVNFLSHDLDVTKSQRNRGRKIKQIVRSKRRLDFPLESRPLASMFSC